MKRPSITEIVGDELRITRLRAKLTQEKLAEMAGVERSLISDLERGVSNPSLYFFVRLASAMGDQPDEVMTRVWTEFVEKGGRLADLPAGVKTRGAQASKVVGAKSKRILRANPLPRRGASKC